MKKFTDQQIDDALKQAPRSIQEQIDNGEELVNALVSIGHDFKLRIDQVGLLAELNRNMLLGLINPQECLGGLTEMGVSENDARSILIELNKQIFTPLRDKLRNASQGATASPTPKPPIQPQPKPQPVQVPAPRYTAPKPAASPQPPTIVNITMAPPPQKNAAPQPVRTETKPAPTVAPLPPKLGAPPPNLPGALPPLEPVPAPPLPPPVVNASPPPPAKTPLPASEPRLAAFFASRPYVDDPYREPIEP